jgi:hypothetical protein
MEETMRRIIIITATLLVSALGAQAASHKAPQYNIPGIGGLPANLPPGYRAVVNDALNAIQHGSTNPRARDSACLARQAKLADDLEALAGRSDMVERNPGMIGLRSRCMPVHVCVNCPPEY